MSCQYSSSCSCPPVVGPIPTGCVYPAPKCPIVCTPSIPEVSALDACDQLYILAASTALSFISDPSQLCNGGTCDETSPFCINTCTIPFTGQEVTTITVNLATILSDPSLAPVVINIYQKCDTTWFKIPCSVLYDFNHCSEYPSTVGSVSITKSPGCPQQATGRILLDGFCYPINFKLTSTTSLISSCNCPPYLSTNVDLVVESNFQKFFHSQSFQCLDSSVAQLLAGIALSQQVKALFLDYILTATVADSCDGTNAVCAIGNNCL